LSSKAKAKEKEEKDSFNKIVKKENHFATKGDIKKAFLLEQSFYLLLSRETFLSTAIPLEHEVIPQVKELLDEGLVHKSLNPCASGSPGPPNCLGLKEPARLGEPVSSGLSNNSPGWAASPPSALFCYK